MIEKSQRAKADGVRALTCEYGRKINKQGPDSIRLSLRAFFNYDYFSRAFQSYMIGQPFSLALLSSTIYYGSIKNWVN